MAYWLVAPDPHHHASLLLSTGHGYWGIVTPVAMGLAVAGIAGALISRSGAPSRFGAVAGRAVALQLVAFLSMETIERATVGGSLVVVKEPVVLVGLALQMLIALALAGLLLVLTRALDSLNGSNVLPLPAVDGSQPPAARTESPTVPQLRYGGALLRAPPAASNI
ncbi:hypothetical protein BH20ACT23_BH20ACT23_17850 [soil metagenome]